MAQEEIDIAKEVNPHFQSVWTTDKPFNILRGGRNSFKSSVIALLLVFMMILYIQIGEKANIVVIRKVGNTIRDSVFLKIQWALRQVPHPGRVRLYGIAVQDRAQRNRVDVLFLWSG